MELYLMSLIELAPIGLGLNLLLKKVDAFVMNKRLREHNESVSSIYPNNNPNEGHLYKILYN